MKVNRNGDVSFWYADIGGIPARRAALPGDVDADVCIVGAGFTGLWTAYYLKKADPSLNVVIVEKEFAGFGASGRNGGWLSGGFGWNRQKYLATATRQSIIGMDAALRESVDEVIRVVEAEGIDADIVRTHTMSAACSPAQMERLKAAHATAMSWEVPQDRVRLIGAKEARERINVHSIVGAMLTSGVARVQPAKLVRGLAAAVERLGVRIYEGTTVTGIEKGRVFTDRGDVTAAKIVRATEGFTAGIRGYKRLWIPLNSAIIVTEPLSEELWAKIGWDRRELLGDASHGYSYAQRTRENRIAMGGRGVPYRFGSRIDASGTTQDETIRQLHAILTRLLPQAANARIDHAWCGVLGVPRDWCATVGIDRRTDIAWAGGYVGTGVSTTNLSGRTLADLVLGRETELTGLAWVNRSVRKWEPEPLRWLGVHGMYRLYHMADAHEARSGGATTSPLARFANMLTGR